MKIFKLFMRNKVIEIMNIIYNHLYIIHDVLYGISVMLMVYGAMSLLGYIVPYLDFGIFPIITDEIANGGFFTRIWALWCGGTALLGMVLIPLICAYFAWRAIARFVKWVEWNIWLAKHGKKIMPNWGRK